MSVIMGVYYQDDDLEPLRRAVGSVLNQSYTDFELLICDDGSCDGAVAYLNEAAGSDARIRLIRPGNRHTLAEKLNVCLREAAGEFIARMDDDDYSHPDRFCEQLRFLRENPNIAFAGCWVNLVRGGAPAGRRILPMYPVAEDFLMTQPFIHPALLFRGSALERVGGYCEEKRCVLCEDYDMLMRLYAEGLPGANMPQVLFDYTIPSTAKGSRRMSHRWNEARTRWRCFSRLGMMPMALPFVLKPLAVGLLPEPMLKRLKEKQK